MKKKLKFLILLTGFLLIGIGIYLSIPKKNIECKYTIKYDDYNIEYIDHFYFDNNSLTNITHSTIYKFNKNYNADTTKIYDTLLKNYFNYNDIHLTTKVSKKEIIFNFEFDIEKTSNNTYYGIIGIPKDFIINNNREEIINRYKLDYNDAICKKFK